MTGPQESQSTLERTDELATSTNSPVSSSESVRKPVTPPRRKKKNGWYSQSAAAFRWLHIYLSMLGFTALMFFSFTGITLNHPTWFGASEQSLKDRSGTVPAELLAPQNQTTLSKGAQTDASINELKLVEWMRSELKVRGAVSEIEVDQYECFLVFKGPGYAADLFIDRESGTFTMTEMTTGVMAVMNDLHKGRDSGAAWKWVIDLSAVLSLLLSISGFGLLLYLRRRRFSGIMTAVAGTVVLFAVWLFFTP